MKATDDVNSIAAANGVTPLLLTSFNRLSTGTKLILGQTITLPCRRALAFFQALQTPAVAAPLLGPMLPGAVPATG